MEAPNLFDMSLRGVLEAGGWRSNTDLDTMTHDDMRNTLIVVLSENGGTPETFTPLDDMTIISYGAMLVAAMWFGYQPAAATYAPTQWRALLIEVLMTKVGFAEEMLYELDDESLVRTAVLVAGRSTRAVVDLGNPNLCSDQAGDKLERSLEPNEDAWIFVPITNNAGAPIRNMAFAVTFDPSTPIADLTIGLPHDAGADPRTFDLTVLGPVADGAVAWASFLVETSATCTPGTYPYSVQLESYVVDGPTNGAPLSSSPSLSLVVSPS